MSCSDHQPCPSLGLGMWSLHKGGALTTSLASMLASSWLKSGGLHLPTRPSPTPQSIPGVISGLKPSEPGWNWIWLNLIKGMFNHQLDTKTNSAVGSLTWINIILYHSWDSYQLPLSNRRTPAPAGGGFASYRPSTMWQSAKLNEELPKQMWTIAHIWS